MRRWMKKPATLARSGSSVTMVPSTRGRSRRVSPASWAAIITAVSADVATSPNSAHPAQSISVPAELLGLGVEAGKHLLERFLEAGDALLLEGQPDVIHVDADVGQPPHHLGCLVHADVDGAGQAAVVLEGGDGVFGQGVDGVVPDELVDVPGVRVGGVLGGRGGPQRPLPARTQAGQTPPPLAGELLLEQTVCELRLGDCGLAA